MEKKIVFAFLTLFLWGCGKNYNNVVNDVTPTYRVVSISPIAPFRYLPSDSLVSMEITIQNYRNVKSVSLLILNPAGNYINSIAFQMQKGNVNSIGGQSFSAKYPMSRYYPSGQYSVMYFVTDVNNSTDKVGFQKFDYDNASKNIAPVISNLVAPDTLAAGNTLHVIFISVFVHDDNGLKDIKRVFFNSFIPPDGHPSSSNPFIMYDNGTNGDITAGDGTYSLKIQLPPNVPKGKYRWEFLAQDWSGAYSNKIIHFVVVK
ncbi:MAG TPA: hypothetical protein ENI61_00245 [Ignavibacteria bacterium]|nr:hypothetical protein [Ignavibacteria bacterium]